MKEAVTLNFKDLDTNESALAIVRYNDALVAFALSHESGGDVEVVMTKADAMKLLDGLKIATSY